MSGAAAPVAEDVEAAFRYGIVFLVVLLVVVFIIVTPDGDLSRAVTFVLVAGALLVVAGTSRERSGIRRREVLGGAAASAVVTVGIATGVVSRDASFVLTALVTLSIPISLSRGLLRLVRSHGATLQAVAGGLAIYLTLGLAFGSLIGFAAAIGPSHFFSQGTNGSVSADVYYSFSVLTTTGFGDYTAAHHLGRALAVIEMLVGQIYLVTVIGVLVGRRVGNPH